MGISGKWTLSNYSEAVKATTHAGCLAILVKLSQEHGPKGRLSLGRLSLVEL